MVRSVPSLDATTVPDNFGWTKVYDWQEYRDVCYQMYIKERKVREQNTRLDILCLTRRRLWRRSCNICAMCTHSRPRNELSRHNSGDGVCQKSASIQA